MCQNTFILLECKLGILMEEEVTVELVKTEEEERNLAIERIDFHEGIPAISVVVDAGWSKHTHNPLV